MPEHAIFAPIGGFGNHLRWLSLLDLRFVKFDYDGKVPMDRVLANTSEERANFILTEVYADKRSWHNWLRWEWDYRKFCDELVFFSHNPDTIFRYRVGMVVDPQFAYKSYVKFNSSINNFSKKAFFEHVVEVNERIYQTANAVIDATDMFTEILPRECYNSLIQTFGLVDNYDLAKMIHQKWYHLHKKAEQEIVHDLASLYRIDSYK